jgi:N-glycosylase/DNA lyase
MMLTREIAMKFQLSRLAPFNLHFTLCCGQVFRWGTIGEWWYGVVGEKVFNVRQIGDELEFENADVGFVKDYFRFHDNLPKIFSQINKDRHIKRAIEGFKGLRIIRQDPWECLISYICATYKNIPAIKQMLSSLSRKFGNKTSLNGHNFYTFPKPEKLAKATIRQLAGCGLGYRAKYVLETARIVYNEGFNLDDLRKANYEKARCKLLSLPGVGLKVADCTLLFSLEKLEAFPVDVWMKRIILKYYANNFPKEFIKKISNRKSPTKAEYEKLSLFGRRYFGECAGYAQEYLYHYERTHGEQFS